MSRGLRYALILQSAILAFTTGLCVTYLWLR